MTERTPTPYRLEWEEEFDTFHHGVIGRYPVGVKGANNCWVVRFDDDYGTDQALDGEFIVRAVNSHEELLAVAKAIRDSRPEYDTAEETEQLKTRLALAIARAEEGKA